MTKTLTFPLGGIHPDKHKASAQCPIQEAGIPELVHIPIQQHIGNPAKILVKAGDKVKVGSHLADADGIISADVHSSVSGEVLKVEEVAANTGYLVHMITIKVEGDDWEPSIDRSPDVVTDIPYSAEEIVQKIRAGGVVGMGGAGFPTPVKTTLPNGKTVDYLILNGIECEPWLTADHRLMVEHAEELIIGAKIINKALGIQNAIIAIDENKPDAIEILTRISKQYVGVNVVVLKTKYPQGAEKQLIKAITGREVPSGKLPADVGCIVQNVGTVFAIYEVVQKHKPLFERIVTFSGSAIHQPCNLRVRIGTSASFITGQYLARLSSKESSNANTTIQSQLDFLSAGKFIYGGPMMGISAVNVDAPITKTTSGILLMSEQDSYKPQESACIRCAKCVDVCPMGLRPFAISVAARNQNYAGMKQLSVMDCIECGCCSYICPAKIPLLDYCKLGKYELRKRK